MNHYKILVVDDEPEILDSLCSFLFDLGHEVVGATNSKSALQELTKTQFDFIFSDVHMPGGSGLSLLRDFCNKKPQLTKAPSWYLMTADASNDVLESATKLGALDVFQKPFDYSVIQKILENQSSPDQSTLNELMALVQEISGIQLGSDKKHLVETRLMRRARALGLESVDNYVGYFSKNKKTEVNHLISALSTHTTEFFREPDHFDFLFDNVFPKLLAARRPFKIWSAASSTGQELYSIVISWLEYLNSKGIDYNKAPKGTFVGTDIDFASVEVASEGIFEKAWTDQLQTEMYKKYFEVGENELAQYSKIIDQVNSLCKFEQMNLLASQYIHNDCDVIFLRNVLIYFKVEDVKKIVTQIEKSLTPDGMLFVGHSEALTHYNLPFKMISSAVYQTHRTNHISRTSAFSRDVIKSSVDLKQKQGLIKVFIVDDSMTVRKMLTRILSPEFGFEVVGEAENPIQADEKLKTVSPDLMTLDIHMPEMDGITYLEKLGRKQAFQVVVISSINADDAIHSLKCFDLGAVDYIEKPHGLNLIEEAEKIRTVLTGVAKSRKVSQTCQPVNAALSIDYISNPYEKDLIVIGASTGGVDAIKVVLTQFPEDSPPILIVQHIPPVFSAAFAKRLNDVCKIEVKEASDGEEVKSRKAYIAPGARQMKVVPRGDKLFIQISDDAPVNRHRPSVDYLFEALASKPELRSWKISAALLTGMGTDGARGLKALKEKKAHTIAQDEESSVVFGMPKEAILLGGAVEVLPLQSIAYHLFKGLKRSKKAAA